MLTNYKKSICINKHVYKCESAHVCGVHIYIISLISYAAAKTTAELPTKPLSDNDPGIRHGLLPGCPELVVAIVAPYTTNRLLFSINVGMPDENVPLSYMKHRLKSS